MQNCRVHSRLAIALVCAAFASLASVANAGPCDSPAHRAFDFWIGHWDVRTPDGKLAGTNKIERVQGGCALQERYTTARGYAGESLNIYDESRKVWHQTWVDNTGTLLVLEGGMRDGSMVLEGGTTGADNKTTKNRITWTANKDGSVRQHWEIFDEGGKWKTSFDGLYKRKDQ
jgi:hypothetical protein